MDRKYIDDNAIGIKYLRGQLQGEELEQFEIYMMENPEIIDELEVDEVMRMNNLMTRSNRYEKKSEMFGEGIFEVEKISPALKARKTGSGGFNKFQNFLSFALGAVMVGLFYTSSPESSPEMYTLLVDDGLRGGSQKSSTVIELKEESLSLFSRHKFIVELPVGASKDQPYEIEIFQGSGSGEAVMKIDEVATNAFGELVLLLRTNRFEPALYVVRASHHDSKRSLNFNFETVVIDGVLNE